MQALCNLSSFTYWCNYNSLATRGYIIGFFGVGCGEGRGEEVRWALPQCHACMNMNMHNYAAHVLA